MANAAPRTATLYRMVMDTHVCPYGLKARDLLRRQGYAVEDHTLRTREETDAFKAEHGVKTTPQVFIEGERVGGYDDLRRFFGKRVVDPKAMTYRPVAALFAMTALMALAASQAIYATPFTSRAAEWFVAFSMAVLALLKLQNVESFATMFLNYDLLAKRWVPYSYVYPFAEGLAGILMIAGVAVWAAAEPAIRVRRGGEGRGMGPPGGTEVRMRRAGMRGSGWPVLKFGLVEVGRGWPIPENRCKRKGLKQEPRVCGWLTIRPLEASS